MSNSVPPSPPEARYTRNVLLQMLVVFLLLAGVVVWQWEVVRAIYFSNQINAVGWAINGGIMLLFLCGLAVLVGRFFEYRAQESGIEKFLANLAADAEPMFEVDPRCMLAARYQTVTDLARRHAEINQNALAATLLATESSRNSFPKFVHNVLILTGVFGTIISLSLSLLGASDLIHGNVAGAGEESSGLGTMIFGMSTALSTTMTAILAYLIFGYFYIKLTDTQTYLISRVEEVTATTLLPHLRAQGAAQNAADLLRNAGELIERFDRSQANYEHTVATLNDAARALTRHLEEARIAAADAITREELETLLGKISEQRQESASESRALLSEAVRLLREGFRLRGGV